MILSLCSPPLLTRWCSPDVLVSYISQVMTLLPGDVVLTGTPEGIGPMQVGDRVRVEIEGIGYLDSTLVSREHE